MKVGDIVIAPEGCNPWLTSGKEYVVSYVSDTIIKEYGYFFQVLSDTDVVLDCVQIGCSHLNVQDWILSPTKHHNSQDDKTIIK